MEVPIEGISLFVEDAGLPMTQARFFSFNRQPFYHLYSNRTGDFTMAKRFSSRLMVVIMACFRVAVVHGLAGMKEQNLLALE